MTNTSINKLHESGARQRRDEQPHRERSTTGDYDAADCTTA